jgi:hypothetical protein
MPLLVFGRPACLTKLAYRRPLPRLILCALLKLPEGVPLAVRSQMRCVHYGALAHFSRAVRCVLSDTSMTDGKVEEDPMRGQIWYLWIVMCGDTQKPLCMQLLLIPKRHWTIALWMPVRLSATTLASFNGCGGPWWDVSRGALNPMEDISTTYYKYTLSAVTHKLNVSGHM